jgi:3-methylcrotonyl-CoA carboxylase beta subunit
MNGHARPGRRIEGPPGEKRAGEGMRRRQNTVARVKLLPRDRVEMLLDPGTPFLELSPLAAFGMYGDESPGAGIITGIGRIAGRECVWCATIRR